MIRDSTLYHYCCISECHSALFPSTCWHFVEFDLDWNTTLLFTVLPIFRWNTKQNQWYLNYFKVILKLNSVHNYQSITDKNTSSRQTFTPMLKKMCTHTHIHIYTLLNNITWSNTDRNNERWNLPHITTQHDGNKRKWFMPMDLHLTRNSPPFQV